jgi:molybdopterin synthase sulfur carrier subunit
VKLKLKTFGAVREILGGKEIDWELEGSTVSDLKHQLFTIYPSLTGLNSLLIAVNQSYAEDRTALHESDEIALIPPVGRI